MSGCVLYVEDDACVRESFVEYFKRREYSVLPAETGIDGLALMEDKSQPVDVIVLDLRMRKMGGIQFLRECNRRPSPPPPIIVLSAYFDDNAVRVCLKFGVRCLFEKPFELDALERAVSALIARDDRALASLVADSPWKIDAITDARAKPLLFRLKDELTDMVVAEDPIGTMVKKREAALYRCFTEESANRTAFETSRKEPLFVVARRWNSWYPSVFDVPGGAYVVAGPSCASRRSPIAVIDPGFTCLRVLRRLGISVHDVEAFVVSHDHPDHVAGLFELIASRHALGARTKGWCNQTTAKMFGGCAGFGLEIHELNERMNSVLFLYSEASGENAKVCVRGFDTAHREMGIASAPLGLCLSCSAEQPGGDRPKAQAIVLGDTEYNRERNKSRFVGILTDDMVSFVVLHVGSVQMKYREGGHLYYPGLKRILLDMDSAIQEKGRRAGSLPVLVSEWGLEHATKEQIAKVCGRELDGFDERSPMVEMTEFLNKELQEITLLPADIGLRIGLVSGQVYLSDGTQVPAENVEVSVTEDGLEYDCA